jgi:hypothetical protein
MNLVLTENALRECLERSPSDDWFKDALPPADGTWGVVATDVGNYHFVIHRSDSPNASRILVAEEAWLAIPPGCREEAFQRVHRFVLAAQRPPIRLPLAWSEYHHRNQTAFFACSRAGGALRWVAEVATRGGGDIIFWKLTGEGQEISLETFDPPYAYYLDMVDQWRTALDNSRDIFGRLPVTISVAPLQPAIDLEAITFGAVTQHRTYTQWMQVLTAQQRQFVEDTNEQPLKLRGPAGTGKTLALELKALHEVYRAREQGKSLRVLFSTHSWAVAEQVDAALRKMDETGRTTEIEVFPLVEIARSNLPTERTGRGFKLLGEDSLSGKQLQLERLSEVVEQLAKSEWLIYRKHSSESFRARIEAGAGSPGRNALVWDLMIEFFCVLSAHGILPGVNAERKYLSLQRTPWMMPLENDAEKQFVVRAYSEYIESLKNNALLTSDQLINDYLNYLATFTWNLKRESDGYDLILIDELHLFSEQERLVFQFLSRSPKKYPRVVMALDPRQAPWEVYAEFAGAPVTRRESGAADESLGSIRSVVLTVVHRFTPEILALVQHIHRSFPALNLGSDWELDVGSLETTERTGEKPLLFVHGNDRSEIEAVLRRNAALQSDRDVNARTAIVLLDPFKITEYESVANELRVPVRVIASRDDVANLRYSKKALVLSAAEYIGGLQFDNVIVSGIEGPQGVANLGYQLRRLLSLLYLGVSRAKRHVELHVNDAKGGVPEILARALEAGIIVRPQK